MFHNEQSDSRHLEIGYISLIPHQICEILIGRLCNILTICLACDTTEQGRSLFHEFTSTATVFSSGNDLLNHICASGEQLIIRGYLINSYQFQNIEVTTKFCKLQLA